MSRRAVNWVAWSSCALILALILCAASLAVLNRYDLGDANFLIAEASAALVGALISSRQPRNPVGWLILGHAFCFTLGEFTRQYAIYGAQTEPGALPFAQAAIWPAYWVWYPGLILMAVLLPLYFPDGRLVSSRWSWIPRLAVVLTVFATGSAMFRPSDVEAPGIPNPLGLERLFEGLRPFSFVAEIAVLASWLFLSAAAAVALVVRFRRSPGEERQQIKWFVYAVVFLVFFNTVSQLFVRSLLPEVVSEVFFLVSLQGLWVAIAIAILRYRLYDVDVLINRTLVYATLSAMLVAVYFGVVIFLEVAVRVATGQQSQLAIVASTLAIAALFNPLRRRVQSFVDRRFYRQKYNAQQTLEAFSARLRDETDLEHLTGELLSVAQKTLRPEHASLWLRKPDQFGRLPRDEGGADDRRA